MSLKETIKGIQGDFAQEFQLEKPRRIGKVCVYGEEHDRPINSKSKPKINEEVRKAAVVFIESREDSGSGLMEMVTKRADASKKPVVELDSVLHHGFEHFGFDIDETIASEVFKTYSDVLTMQFILIIIGNNQKAKSKFEQMVNEEGFCKRALSYKDNLASVSKVGPLIMAIREIAWADTIQRMCNDGTNSLVVVGNDHKEIVADLLSGNEHPFRPTEADKGSMKNLIDRVRSKVLEIQN